MNSPSTFASRVKERREQLQISQAELARRVGISQVAIKKIEGGGNTRHGRLLAEALGVSLTFLETGQNENSTDSASATPPGQERDTPPQKWPFASISEASIRALPPEKLNALEGAMALAIAQMKLGITVSPTAQPAQPPAATPVRSHKPGGLVDMDATDDPFPMRIKGLPAAPWEGGKTTKQMEDTAEGVLISHAVDVGHVPDSGYSANDHEFIPIPELDVRLAAGTLGIENYQETEIGQILLRRSFLESFGLPIDRMRIVYSDGDSMEPAIRNRNPMLLFIERINDMLKINRRIVYAINQGGSMLVKCISRTRDGIWLAKSLNPAYKPIPLTRDDGRDVNIVGRILWSPNDLRNGVDERLLRS